MNTQTKNLEKDIITKMKILKEISIKTDNFREETKSLGELAVDIFSNNKAQMKNLENIANSALKISDVLDFIKRQTGRSKANEQWKKNNFGNKLLNKIENELKSERDKICQLLTVNDDYQKLEIYLQLVREYIRQIVIHYEFKLSFKDEK